MKVYVLKNGWEIYPHRVLTKGNEIIFYHPKKCENCDCFADKFIIKKCDVVSVYEKNCETITYSIDGPGKCNFL